MIQLLTRTNGQFISLRAAIFHIQTYLPSIFYKYGAIKVIFQYFPCKLNIL